MLTRPALIRPRTPAAIKVGVTAEFNLPANEAWKQIGGFDVLADWRAAVEKSETEGEGEGLVRRLSRVGGGAIVERLKRADDEERP